eukprot:12905383-Prorocentrum_lima.AAC.1
MSVGEEEEREEGVVTALKEKCKGALHSRVCEKCKKALGSMRVHEHGKSNSQSVLSADLSRPRPEALGIADTYLFVAVFHPEKTNLPFRERASKQNSKG